MAKQTSPKVETVDLNLHPNEASDLLPVANERILEAHGWDRAFWTVLDDGAVEGCVALIGHLRGGEKGDGRWETARPRFRVEGDKGATETPRRARAGAAGST